RNICRYPSISARPEKSTISRSVNTISPSGAPSAAQNGDSSAAIASGTKIMLDTEMSTGPMEGSGTISRMMFDSPNRDIDRTNTISFWEVVSSVRRMPSTTPRRRPRRWWSAGGAGIRVDMVGLRGAAGDGRERLRWAGLLRWGGRRRWSGPGLGAAADGRGGGSGGRCVSAARPAAVLGREHRGEDVADLGGGIEHVVGVPAGHGGVERLVGVLAAAQQPDGADAGDAASASVVPGLVPDVDDVGPVGTEACEGGLEDRAAGLAHPDLVGIGGGADHRGEAVAGEDLPHPAPGDGVGDDADHDPVLVAPADQLDRARARGGQVLVPVQEQGQLRALEPQGGAQR